MRLFVLVVAVVLAGCSSLCDRTSALKTGDCTGVSTAPVLGDKATCSMRLMGCSEADKKAVTGALDCLDALGTCSAASQSAWESQQHACYVRLESLTPACQQSLYLGVLPGHPVDSGTPDAGLQPMDDGGSGVSFVAVADESSFAFAWVPLQKAMPLSWELDGFDLLDGGRLPDTKLSAGLTFMLLDAGAGLSRRCFVGGRDAQGQIVIGAPGDAGPAMSGGNCSSHADCFPEQVCDLNQCKSQVCQTNATCPQPDYRCNVNVTPHTCVRMSTMGGIDAGPVMTGPETPLPMVSNSWSATTGAVSFFESPIGGFTGRRPDMVALDSAQQFVALEQQGQPVGHYTVRRGRDFINDPSTATVIDTVGANVKVAFNKDSQVLFACYTVGQGVRVRRSFDLGRSWGVDALDLMPDDDGGSTLANIFDCDLTPWKNGAVLMVTVDGPQLKVRQIDGALHASAEQIAFTSSDTDGGGSNIFYPQRPAIAALPDSDLVHIAFTGSRIVGAITDTDIYGVYRGSGGQFSQPMFVDAPGGMNGNGAPQDYVTLAIDPVTKKALAAWTALEDRGFGIYSTVYLGFFTAQNSWITGSDLSVFMQSGSNNSYPLFPAHQNDLWDAFSPQLAVQPGGRVWLSMLAGRREISGANTINPYVVGFAFDAGSPVGGNGWFRPPAVKMSETVAADPRAGGNYVPPSNSALAADSQLSIYGAFIEGVGSLSSMENRGVFLTRP